jgi:clavulanate-9-aldehyde reductase
MLNTNLLGMMFMTHAALPHVLERRGGLVQISSICQPDRAGRHRRLQRDQVGRRRVQRGAAPRGHPARPAGGGGPPRTWASAIVYAVTQPEHASVNEILMRPTDQLW